MGIQGESLYDTWWFTTGFAILSAAFLWLLFKLKHINRTERLKKLVAEQALQLKEYISRLERAQQRLERENYIHKRLSASISHDVKNPLHFAVLSLRKIHQQLQQEKHPLARAIYNIETSTYEIQQYTEMLTDYSRILLMGKEIETQPIGLRNLIQEKIKLFDKMAAQKGITFVKKVSSEIKLNANRQLLHIVLHNLIDNAIKFTLEGHITFESKVLVDALELSVQDNGVGMNMVQVARINLYNQKSKEEDVNGQFTQGLGLKIAKDLISLMNGTLYVKSTLQVGTIATIRLPL